MAAVTVDILEFAGVAEGKTRLRSRVGTCLWGFESLTRPHADRPPAGREPA